MYAFELHSLIADGKRPGEPFMWVQLYAAAGDYVVGFIAEDLDGNQYPAYAQITVR